MSSFQTPPPENHGRKDAVEFTAKFGPGTVGQVVHTAVKPFASIFGDVGSGTIGAHYREREEALKQPATGTNIKEFAETETKYWNKQPGIPGFIGSSMSAQTREDMLNCTKSKLINSGQFTAPKDK